MPAKVILVLAQPYNDEQHQRVLQRVIAILSSLCRSDQSVSEFWQCGRQTHRIAQKESNGLVAFFSSSVCDVDIIVLVNPTFAMLLDTVRNNLAAVFTQEDCRCHILYAGFTVNRTSNWLMADCILNAIQLDELLARCQTSVISYKTTTEVDAHATLPQSASETRKNNNNENDGLSIDCRSMPPDYRRCSPAACGKVSKAFHAAIANDTLLHQIDSLLHASRAAVDLRPISQMSGSSTCSITVLATGDGDSFVVQIGDYRMAVNVGYTDALRKHVFSCGALNQLLITHLGFDTVAGLRYLDAHCVRGVLANVPLDAHAFANTLAHTGSKNCSSHTHQSAAPSLSIEPITEYRNFVAQLLQQRISPQQYAIGVDEQTPKFVTLHMDEDSALLMLVLGPNEASTEWLRFGQLVRGERFTDAMRLRDHTFPLNDIVSGAMLLMSVTREPDDTDELQVHTVLYAGNLPTRLLLKELDRIAGLDLLAVAHAVLVPRRMQSGEYVLDEHDYDLMQQDSIRSHFQLPAQRFAGGVMRPLVTINE